MLTDIGIRVTLNVPYEQAVRKTTDALTAARFGVLTQIDMKVRVKQKGDGSVVAAVDPVRMIGAFKEDPVAHEVAVDAKTRLQRAITSLK